MSASRTRWRCVQCNWHTDHEPSARQHFASTNHMALTYNPPGEPFPPALKITNQDRLDDLLKLREELAR